MNFQVVEIIGGGGGQNDMFAPQYFQGGGAIAPLPPGSTPLSMYLCKLTTLQSSNKLAVYIINRYCESYSFGALRAYTVTGVCKPVVVSLNDDSCW